jgi:hypothetical protein
MLEDFTVKIDRRIILVTKRNEPRTHVTTSSGSVPYPTRWMWYYSEDGAKSWHCVGELRENEPRRNVEMRVEVDMQRRLSA